MALFSLIAKLGLDKTGFDAGLSSAQKGVARFSAGLKSQLAAAFSVAAITAYTRSLVEYASKVKDASLRTGAGTDALQTLGHAAKLTGSDFDAVVRSMKDLSKARQEALDQPGSKAAQVFKALGIDGQKLKDLKLEDLFREIGRAFEGNDFGASELALVTELLGRAGGELLPAFKEGLFALEEQAREAGVVLGEELIDPLDEMGDQLETLTGQLRGPFAEALVFVLKLANDLLTQLKNGFEVLTNFAEGFKAGVKEGGEESKIPKFLRMTPIGAALAKATEIAGAVGRGIERGKQQVGEALDAAQEEERPEDGFMFGFAKDQKERKRREFHFENLLKEREPKERKLQTDSLGRIGGTVGAGESTTHQQLRELVREFKELRRTFEIRGIRINGEL